MKVTIANKHFASKAKAKDYMRDLIKRLRDAGGVIKAGADYEFLKALFAHHPEPYKLAQVAAMLDVSLMDIMGTPTLTLGLPDGDTDTISWVKCIENIELPFRQACSAMKASRAMKP